MYVTAKKLKKKAFRINSQNIKQAIGIQVTIITEIRLQKKHFLAKKHSLLVNLGVHFESLLGSEYVYICHD